jgi:anti-sigma B factor antagonist
MDDDAMQASAPAAPGPEWTIHEAARLREQLLAHLEAGSSCLDLSGVSACDSAGVQLLLAARRSAQQRGQTLELLQPSDAVLESLRRYGLGPLLFGHAA